MEVSWKEKVVLTAVRVFSMLPTAWVNYLSIESRDGGLVEFNTVGDCKINVQLYPSFTISLVKKPAIKYIFRRFPPSINLMQEKHKYPSFSDLPEKYNNEDDLLNILEGYKKFIETHYTVKGEITF